MTFYIYDQNNSGGKFVSNEELCHRVIIEANSEEEANAKALSKGIYFNGVAKGEDCECCGDRWHEAREESSYVSNSSKEDFIDEETKFANEYGYWTSPTSRIFFSDGSVLEIEGKKGNN